MKQPGGLLVLGIGLILAVSVAYAVEDPDREQIREALQAIAPDAEISSVEATPIEGLYEVVIGRDVLYMTAEGRYLLQGNLVDLEERKNLTEEAKARVVKDLIDGIDEEEMIIYEPDEEVRHTVTVFTDIECPYCQRMHQEMDDYLAWGIRVRYLAFPPQGPDSEAFEAAEAVWCSDDRNAAMDRAKAGETVEAPDCTNPVRSHFELARNLRVPGTPALVMPDGQLVPSYLSPGDLVAMLEGDGRGR